MSDTLVVHFKGEKKHCVGMGLRIMKAVLRLRHRIGRHRFLVLKQLRYS